MNGLLNDGLAGKSIWEDHSATGVGGIVGDRVDTTDSNRAIYELLPDSRASTLSNGLSSAPTSAGGFNNPHLYNNSNSNSNSRPSSRVNGAIDNHPVSRFKANNVSTSLDNNHYHISNTNHNNHYHISNTNNNNHHNTISTDYGHDFFSGNWIDNTASSNVSNNTNTLNQHTDDEHMQIMDSGGDIYFLDDGHNMISTDYEQNNTGNVHIVDDCI